MTFCLGRVRGGFPPSTLWSPSLDKHPSSGQRQIRVLASVTHWQFFVYLKWEMDKRKHKTDEWAKVWINNFHSWVTDGCRTSVTTQIDLQDFWKGTLVNVFLKQKLQWSNKNDLLLVTFCKKKTWNFYYNTSSEMCCMFFVCYKEWVGSWGCQGE